MSEGRDLDHEEDRFRDWAKAGGHTRKDWDATFNNWLRSEYGRGSQNGTRPKKRPSDVAVTDEEFERWYGAN